MGSFKGEFQVDGVWYDNAIRLPDRYQATAYAQHLFDRWTVPTDKRVVASEDAPNYTADSSGVITAIKEESEGA